MQELIDAVAAATGWPPAMVERSARARAQASGITPEEVLAAWAGGEAPAITTAAAATAAPPAAPTPAPAAASPAPEAEPEPELEVEVVESPAEPEPEPEPVPARPPLVPRWLAASFVLLPAVALFYALFFPNGADCGVGAQLAIDAVTGEAENCDGSPYGVEVVDYFSQGEEIYAVRCAACHGADGAGSGNFPALSGGAVVETFPGCPDHIGWVELGTLGWPDTTYGATAKPVGGSGAQMPAFGDTLTPEELASVVLFERVAFGGLAVPDVEADCGLTELAAAGE
jgi:mono/diheme cytochrome c family protein